jgi:hypothetical protein
MGKLAWFAATPAMVAGCYYVMGVTVGFTGTVFDTTDARPHSRGTWLCPGCRPGGTSPARHGARAHGAWHNAEQQPEIQLSRQPSPTQNRQCGQTACYLAEQPEQPPQPQAPNSPLILLATASPSFIDGAQSSELPLVFFVVLYSL